MDDLVKRLREVESNHSGWGYAGIAADRIEELEANLEKLERWQAAAFIAHGNLDLDIEANPEALAELKGL